jgi:hypothetical protein
VTILSGERDPERLAALKDPRAKRSVTEIAAALHGDYRAEHLFVLQPEVQLYDFYREQIQRCDQPIEQCLSQFESRPNQMNRCRLAPRAVSPAVMLLPSTYGHISIALAGLTLLRLTV